MDCSLNYVENLPLSLSSEQLVLTFDDMTQFDISALWSDITCCAKPRIDCAMPN